MFWEKPEWEHRSIVLIRTRGSTKGRNSFCRCFWGARNASKPLHKAFESAAELNFSTRIQSLRHAPPGWFQSVRFAKAVRTRVSGLLNDRLYYGPPFRTGICHETTNIFCSALGCGAFVRRLWTKQQSQWTTRTQQPKPPSDEPFTQEPCRKQGRETK